MTEKGSPLSEVIESGLSRPRFSSDCLNVLLKEIKLNIQDGWNKHPVMVIIDGVNVLFQERTFVSKIMPKRKEHSIPTEKYIREACSPDELSLIGLVNHLQFLIHVLIFWLTSYLDESKHFVQEIFQVYESRL